MEDDFFGNFFPNFLRKFQFTSPVWRTTSLRRTKLRNAGNFNPRPPCGGRPFPLSSRASLINFNPRPPCGGRQSEGFRYIENAAFQSTSPVWRTTTCEISFTIPPRDFNPRPPCGGRRRQHPRNIRRRRFQSTSPVWRTTRAVVLTLTEGAEISIHVPRVEDDMDGLT